MPAHNLLAPALAWVIAAARVMPDVCGVFKSSSSECTILTPCFTQSIGKPLVELCIFVAAKPCAERIQMGSSPEGRSTLWPELRAGPGIRTVRIVP